MFYNISEYNGTDEMEAEIEYSSYTERPECFIAPTIFFIIFVVGAFGNGTLTVIFLRHKTLRILPYIYIFLLALADLLVIIACVPFMSIIYTMESWPWGVVICKISVTAETISIGVSAFTLMALSVECYYAIIKPLSLGSRHIKPKTMTLIISLIWILATCFALPDAISSHVTLFQLSLKKTIAYCTSTPDFDDYVDSRNYMKYSILLRFLIYYIVPLCTITYFYIMIAIRRYGSAIEPFHRESQAKIYRTVTRMSLIFAFIFFVCFLPNQVSLMWFYLSPNSEEEYNEVWHFTSFIGFGLGFFRCCVNPVVLFYFNDIFGAHFKRCFCSRGQEADPSEEMHSFI